MLCIVVILAAPSENGELYSIIENAECKTLQIAIIRRFHLQELNDNAVTFNFQVAYEPYKCSFMLSLKVLRVSEWRITAAITCSE